MQFKKKILVTLLLLASFSLVYFIKYKNNNEKIFIPFVTASDNNYSPAVATCLYSVLENTKSNIDIFVLDNGISNENKRKIKKSISKFNNYKISFINMQKFKFNNFPNIHRYTLSTYLRYFIPEIIGNKYDKVIYSDPDVIFKGDIQEYYNIELDGYGLAAVLAEADNPNQYEERKKKFDIDKNHKYFLNGNIIISCNYWRKHNITEQLIKITEKFNKNLVCPDMDAMNFVFQNNYKEIDYKYCVCAHLNIKKINKQNLFEAFDNPFIIHYSGHKKPWIRGDTKFFKEYMRILLKTEFKYLINNL